MNELAKGDLIIYEDEKDKSTISEHIKNIYVCL